MTCEEFEELSGAYALDAVAPAERQAAADHLANCTKCRSLLQELSGAVELLSFTVASVEPRAEMWECIASALPASSTASDPTPAQPAHRVRRRWTPQLLAVAAVLALSLLGAITAWNISLTHQITSLQQQLAHQSTQPPAISGIVTYPVKSTHAAQNIRGKLLYLPKQHLTVLILHGLPQVQGTHVYQGWLLHLKGNEITGLTSIGLLSQVHDTASLSFSGDVVGYDAVAVSLEPGPKATPRTPQGKVIAFGPL